MNKLVKYFSVAFVALITNAFAFAQAEQPVEKKFQINWAETATLYTLDDNNIFAINTQFTTNIDDKLTGGIGLDVFNSTDEDTGLGDLDVFVNYDLYNGNCNFFNANCFVDLIGGVKLPVDGEYSSDNPVFHLGAIAGLKKKEWSLTQKFEYFFVDDYTYDPSFGGFVNDNIVDLVTSVGYDVNKNLTFVLELEQKYADSYHSIVLGPNANFVISNTCSFDVGVGFSVSDDLPCNDLDTVVGFGFKYQF